MHPGTDLIRLVAGGYAGEGARGLYPIVCDGDALSVGSPVAPFVDVSAGIRIPGTTRWFLVEEHAGRIVLADADAGWGEVGSFASGGQAPCHLAIDPGGRVLAVANYGDGVVALHRLDDETGLPIGPPAVYHGTGHGPNLARQEGPHAHWVGYAPNGLLYTVDLGSDRVFAFSVDADTGTFGRVAVAYEATPGSGPRQLVFHPQQPIAYLVSELASTLSVLRVGEDGSLAASAIVSTLPVGAPAGSLVGAIAIADDSRHLYVSNRGHDSIATFALGDDGAVVLLGHVSSGGRSPRYLLVFGSHLLVAHEQAGGVVLFALDGDAAPRRASARVDVPGAAFLGVLEP